MVLDSPKNLTNGHTVVNSKSERSKLSNIKTEYSADQNTQTSAWRLFLTLISARPTQAGPTTLQSLEL